MMTAEPVPRTRLPRKITRRWWATRGWCYLWALACAIFAVGYTLDEVGPTFIDHADPAVFALAAVMFAALGARPESAVRRTAAVVSFSLAAGERAFALTLNVGTGAALRSRVIGATSWTLLWVATVMIAAATSLYCTRRKI